MNDHPLLEPEYQSDLTAHILTRLEGGRPLSFESIVIEAEGAYPTDVKMVLERLSAEGQVHEPSPGVWQALRSQQVEGENDNTSTELTELSRHPDDDLPEPHPLDFDWRFSPPTATSLARKIVDLKVEPIGILGAPTLFKLLTDGACRAHLFDKNSHVIQRLRGLGYREITECNLFNYEPLRTGFACVVADPPWYLDHYRAFIEVSRRLLQPQGLLFLSVLPRLTRPSAANDRSEILSFAGDRGFDLIQVEPGGLEYLSPPFELAALKEEGFHVPSWRRGDLYTFQFTGSESSDWFEPVENHHVWHTFSIGKTIIKLKESSTISSAPFDFSPASGTGSARLRSVSRRSSVRERINLWTSRNIALNATRPDIIADCLAVLETDSNGFKAVVDGMAVKYSLNMAEGETLVRLLRLCRDRKMD